MFSVGEEEKVKRLAPELLDWDGHCMKVLVRSM